MANDREVEEGGDKMIRFRRKFVRTDPGSSTTENMCFGDWLRKIRYPQAYVQ